MSISGHTGESSGSGFRLDDFTDPWVDAEAVVMLHGFARNSEFWRAWVPYLARWFRVIRVDLPGCGGADLPSVGIGTVTADGLERHVWNLLDRLGIEKVHVIGESSGGVVGAWMASGRAERVEKLVLVSTPLRLQGKENPVKTAGYETTSAAIDALGMEEYWLASRGRGGQLTGIPERDRHFAQLFARTDPEVGKAYWAWVNGSGADLTPKLPRILAETLILTPGATFGTSAAEQELMRDSIPRAEQLLYGDLTHEMYYVNPDRLAPDVLDFLRRPRG